MRRTQFLNRSAYALALALASLGAVGVVSAPAEAQRKDDKKAAATKAPQPTKAFIPAYTELKTMLDAAGKRLDVVAAKAKVSETERTYRSARGRAAQDAARGQYEAAVAALAGLLSAEKAKTDEIYTKAANDADKFFAGQLGFTFGGLAVDKAQQRRGLVAMIESGNVPAAEVGKYNYYAAGFAFDLKDYAGAEAALKAAIAGGYAGNDVKGLLAEAQNSAGRPAEALATIRGMVDGAAAAGQVPAAEWLERGVLISYQSKSPDAAEWAIRRVEFYPTQPGWVAAGQILRERGNFGPMESLDISRALDKAGALNTNTQAVQREYIEYMQSAVGKVGVLYPGEVIKVANQGLKATALQSTDPFVRDAMAEANRRLAADKASLAGLERDARAPAATVKTVLIGADTLLSYDQAQKAAELYQIALGKAGADLAAVNLRLGIALVKLGRNDEAQAAFAKVDGPRKGIAQLWTLVAKGKTVPAA
jgi:hypothetical protein